MKTSKISSYKETVSAVRHASQLCVATVLVGFIGFNWATAISHAQPSTDDVPGAEVLTRGPVHEAFAGMVTFNPEPGVVISKAPPEVIEEMPPEERPEGDNVSWIPGYWGWDDERSDFLWVSGTWRALPPGRAWMAGYWGKTPRGHQWISGYWADASVRETTYLPPPPATVEVGPNIAAPSIDYGWSPGCWVWYQDRYAWQPGYWAQGRADWDWMPAHYVWTPRGYIFVGGYWDYPIQRRGIVFAPVYFESSYYARRGYVYSPRIVISLGVFSDHLFLRPSYSHYYFGDYYAPSYYQGGFYASFTFHSGRHGYDPFYSRQRWTHRQDRDWERRTETSYHYRRDHEAARPPRTWAAQRNINPSTAESDQNRMLVAAPIDQIAKRKDGDLRFQPVAKAEREKLSGRGREVQQSREQRRTLESNAEAPTPRKSGETFQPAKVEMPRSPIVARPAKELGRNQAPPQVQKAPTPDLKRQPKSEPAARPQNAERTKPQPEVRQPAPERQPTPKREEAAPRERQVQPEPQPRLKESGAPPQEESERNARGAEQKARQESEQPAKDSQRKAQDEPQQNPSQPAPQARPEPEPRGKDSAVTPRAESRPNAGEVKQEESRRSVQPARQRPAPPEKGAARLMKSDRQKEDKGKR